MDLTPLLVKLFPQTSATFSGRSGFEVNGLPSGSVPQSCDIIAHAQAPGALSSRRAYYLVRVDGALVFLRICSAMPGSGYDEFAVIRSVELSAQAQPEYEARCVADIASLCGVSPDDVRVG